MTKSTIFTDEELREAFEEANTNYNFEAKQKYASKSYVRQLHINRTALKRWIDQRHAWHQFDLLVKKRRITRFGKLRSSLK